MNAIHELRIKRRLERLVHVLLTHSYNRSESKEAFCQRCAWTVEEIIDEIEHPSAKDDMRIGVVAERIRRRIEGRTENDWADYPEFFAGSTRR